MKKRKNYKYLKRYFRNYFQFLNFQLALKNKTNHTKHKQKFMFFLTRIIRFTNNTKELKKDYFYNKIIYYSFLNNSIITLYNSCESKGLEIYLSTPTALHASVTEAVTTADKAIIGTFFLA